MLGLHALRAPFVLVRAAPLVRVGLALSFLAVACSSSGSSGKGLSELCVVGSDCASQVCENVSGPQNQVHSQCTWMCKTDPDCEKIDPRAVCHNEGYYSWCVLGCGKDSDCPQGAHCSYPTGGGCYQN